MDAGLNERAAANYVIYAFVGFFLGKCLANILMKRFNENKVLIAYSVLGSLALVYVIGVHDMSAIWAAIFVSTMFGPCWATIYARSLDAITPTNATLKPAAP